MRRLAGELPLPWEDVQTCSHITRALGRYCGTVLALVDRDPARRPSVAEFIRTSRDIISRTSVSSTEPAAHAGGARSALHVDSLPSRSSV